MKGKEAGKWLIRLIGILLLVLIVWKIGRKDLFARLSEAKPGWVLAAGLICLAHFVIKALRWNYILHRAGVSVRWTKTVQAYFAAALLGMLTPGRLGEFTKAIMVRRWEPSASWGLALGTVVLDRSLDVCAFVLVALWGLVWVGLPGAYRVAGQMGFILVLVLGVTAGLMMWRSILRTPLGMRVKQKAREKIGPSAIDFYRVMKQLAVWRAAPMALLTIAAYVLFFLFFWMLARGFHSTLSADVLSWGIAVASLGALLPVTIGGVGVRDFILLFIFKTWGEDPSRVLAISLTYLGLLYAALAVLGVWPFLAGGLGLRQVYNEGLKTENKL